MKLVLILFGGLVVAAARRHFYCRPCNGKDCDVVPENCPYGFYQEKYCNRLVCKKGPRESCGGRGNLNGVCGEGLSCECGVCTGCSTIDMMRNGKNCHMPPFPCISSDR